MSVSLFLFLHFNKVDFTASLLLDPVVVQERLLVARLHHLGLLVLHVLLLHLVGNLSLLILHHGHLLLLHSCHLLGVKSVLVNLHRQVMGAEQNVYVIGVENRLKLGI